MDLFANAPVFDENALQPATTTVNAVPAATVAPAPTPRRAFGDISNNAGKTSIARPGGSAKTAPFADAPSCTPSGLALPASLAELRLSARTASFITPELLARANAYAAEGTEESAGAPHAQLCAAEAEEYAREAAASRRRVLTATFLSSEPLVRSKRSCFLRPLLCSRLLFAYAEYVRRNGDGARRKSSIDALL